MKLFASLLLGLCLSIMLASTAVGGCIKGDCTNGQGTYSFPDGSLYVGQWKNEKFDGQGTFTYSEGSVYVGQWKNSKRNGRGTYNLPGGSKYVGQWKNDKFDGQGTYTYHDGSVYVGQWKDSMRNGQGSYTSANGSKYVGQWKNGKLIGKGIFITSDSNKFVGHFNDDGKLIGKYIPMVKAEAKAKAVAKKKAEAEARAKAEAKKKAEAEVRAKAEAKKKAEAKARASAVAKQKALAEAKKKDEAEAKAKAEAEAKAEAKKKAEVRAKAEAKKKTEAVKDKKTFTGPNGMEFVYISPGTFKMGSPEDESGRYDNETQHQVTLTQGFYIQATEVTQGQWKTVMGNNPSFFNSCGDDCSVEQVSWNDAQQFIWRLNQLEGADKYRLPTEAEWEYACRAGSTTAFANGGITALECDHDSNPANNAWFCGNSDRKTHPATQKNPNAWGLYDMHGNVSELCQDWYGEFPPDHITDPPGPASGIDRTVRGGGWDAHARHCRSACRGATSPGVSGNGVGLRLARTP
jgi:formylglycine-generating enzyme required for sulfatase activity